MLSKRNSMSALALCGMAAVCTIGGAEHRMVWALAIPEEPAAQTAETTAAAQVVPQAVEAEGVAEAQLGEIRAAVEASLGLMSSSVQRLDISGVREAKPVLVTLGGLEHLLHLYPYSPRSADFLLLVQDESGALIEAEPPAPATYRGRLAGDPLSSVAATVFEGRLWATIVTGTSETWGVQPADEIVPQAPADLHVVYSSFDVIGGDGVCGVDEFVGHSSTADKGSSGDPPAPEGTGGKVAIAFDADLEFFQANGNSVPATIRDIEMIMNQVGLIFQNQVGICYDWKGIIVRTGRVYNNTRDGALLCEFRNFWNANVGGFNQHVAHLMTGKNLTPTPPATNNPIGIAYVGGMCNAYGTITTCAGEGDYAYGLSQSRFSATLIPRVGLTAHELGHNWNACHCNQNGCTGGGADPDCGIMWSAAGPQQSTLLFGTRSANTIINYRNGMWCPGFCYDPIYVDWTNIGGPWFGIPSAPYRTVERGVRGAIVDGTVITAVGNYPENITINKAVTLRATGGTVRIGQ